MKKQPVLSVGIMSSARIDFTLESAYHCGSTQVPQGDYSVSLSDGKMIMEGEGVIMIAADPVILLPVFTGNSFVLKNVTIGKQFHWEQQEDERFTGGLKFIIDEGRICAINTVHLEDYLKSVISSEMSATSSSELLKAHAVTSRSWLLAQMEKSRLIATTGKKYKTDFSDAGEIIRWYDREEHVHYDVCADDHCQRYHGLTKILSPHAVAAVEATFGQVLMNGEEICDARYSKCCGGVTENFENVWEPEHKPYLTATTDYAPTGHKPTVDLRNEEEATQWILSSPAAFCNTSDMTVLGQVLPGFDQKTRDFFRWRAEYNQEELAALIKRRSGIDFGRIIRLDPLERGSSGRMIRLKITGTKQSVVVGKDLEIRKWLSPSHLYSSAFIVHYEGISGGIPGQIILTGAGWGHGVGLCQIGAAVMGELGYGYREILSHYFRNASVDILYTE